MSDPRPSLSSQFCRRQFSLGLACAIGGMGAGFIPTSAHAVLDTLKPISMPSPKTPFADDSGAEVSLDHWHGAPVLVNFWATWCPPCVHELPSLMRLHHILKPDGIKVLLISVDRKGRDKALPFLQKLGIEGPDLGPDLGFDQQSRLAKALELRGLPTTWCVRSDGQMTAQITGDAVWDDPKVIEKIRPYLMG
jgi:thiol-disulfide isomerase/thioredoxin